MAEKREEGGLDPQLLADIICEQPLRYIVISGIKDIGITQYGFKNLEIKIFRKFGMLDFGFGVSDLIFFNFGF